MIEKNLKLQESVFFFLTSLQCFINLFFFQRLKNNFFVVLSSEGFSWMVLRCYDTFSILRMCCKNSNAFMQS